MVEELFIIEHLANSDHNIIIWKTACETFINKNYTKSFVFHKSDYDQINEYFSNFKWDDLFQNSDANECWVKFLKITKESVKLYVPLRGQRKRKVPPWMTKRDLRIRKYKSDLWQKYENRKSYNNIIDLFISTLTHTRLQLQYDMIQNEPQRSYTELLLPEPTFTR